MQAVGVARIHGQDLPVETRRIVQAPFPMALNGSGEYLPRRA
jgi:hypothetical protein